MEVGNSQRFVIPLFIILFSGVLTLLVWSLISCSLSKHKPPCEAYWTGNPKNINKK